MVNTTNRSYVSESAAVKSNRTTGFGLGGNGSANRAEPTYSLHSAYPAAVLEFAATPARAWLVSL